MAKVFKVILDLPKCRGLCDILYRSIANFICRSKHKFLVFNNKRIPYMYILYETIYLHIRITYAVV